MGTSEKPAWGSMGISGTPGEGSMDQSVQLRPREQTAGCAVPRHAASLALLPTLSWPHSGDPLAVKLASLHETRNLEQLPVQLNGNWHWTVASDVLT